MTLRLSLLLALPFLMGNVECWGDECPGGTRIEGDPSELTAGPIDKELYGVSAIRPCDADYPLYRITITGKGSTPTTVDWFDDNVMPQLDWRTVSYGAPSCDGEQPDIVVSTGGWREADDIARAIVAELIADDRNGEIVMILWNPVACAAGSR